MIECPCCKENIIPDIDDESDRVSPEDSFWDWCKKCHKCVGWIEEDGNIKIVEE